MAEPMLHPRTRPIRVLIADDHSLVRYGLATVLGLDADLQLVGEAADGEEAIRRCAELHPDVVLMDLVMPGMDGIAAMQAIHEADPRALIIALTGFSDDALVKRALEAGAIAYLLKDIDPDALLHAIHAAHAGSHILAPAATEALIHVVTHPAPSDDTFTPRERDVLALMAQGLNNSEIAQRLVVSRSTVKFHVSGILAKLSATSRTGAVALAVQHHLVR